jgi:CRISPR-associated exonuclease Cas4
MYPESELLPLSALQHYLFCPRQCALIHLEGIWEENRLTAEGRLLHERADTTTRERRGDILIVRGLWIRSLRLGLAGRADVVEFHRHETGERPFPVEYKRGKPKSGMEDKVQLCAQALCLEEMLQVEIPDGALFYGSQNRRLNVILNAELRRLTEQTASDVHTLLDGEATPAPKPGPQCANCSLVDQCLPDRVGKKASQYLQALLREP